VKPKADAASPLGAVAPREWFGVEMAGCGIEIGPGWPNAASGSAHAVAKPKRRFWLSESQRAQGRANGWDHGRSPFQSLLAGVFGEGE
jgi:hypothetical protein